MRRIKPFEILIIIATSGVAAIIGCGDDTDPVAPMPPWYGQTDSDSAPGQTGTGAETDTTPVITWDNTPLPGINLMPNEEGFMKKEQNALSIQGAWYTFGCDGAALTPLEDSTFTNPGRMCFSGTAPQVPEIDGELAWSDVWGAGMGFDLCAMSEEEVAANPSIDTDTDPGPPKYRMGECPYNPNLATDLIGVSIRFSGYVNAPELRVQFNEGESVANSYYKVAPEDVAAGTVLNIEFKDPLVATHYDVDAKPSRAVPANMYAIQFQVPTKAEGPVDWDFCVDAISAITATGQ